MDNKEMRDMRVVKADNKVQFYVEELQPMFKGIRLWKIAKVYYDIISAQEYIKKTKDAYEAHQRLGKKKTKE